ncbi:hypothetical protein Ddye_025618 [Dipteronia dyeriana]|uniref:Uncharacterized protein n=1 Tax=Dipteronia dyeriana TaxID=168575 RepID=A0AAD9TLI7_9ROSI|nr:hypothetical protein Ddye_025618 [Dipteronia dyeriana]
MPVQLRYLMRRVASKRELMQEHGIVAQVISSIEEGEAENVLNDGAAKVESFFEDLMSTGILTDMTELEVRYAAEFL